MKKNLNEQIKRGLETAFINSNVPSLLEYRPQLITNNYKQGRKVLSAIEEELRSCDQFIFNVAFITMGGLTPLLPVLKELEKRNIPGCILTTDYKKFNSPDALEKLATFKNIVLKMYCTNGDQDGFHTKGYIFRKGEMYRMIVGSSNITGWALTKNKEWNTRIISTIQGEYANQIIEDFNQLWKTEFTKDYDEIIDSYRMSYSQVKKQRFMAKEGDESDKQLILKPNKMQMEFVSNLKSFRKSGEKKALLISATGTGKTYAAAFALREANPPKALFLVHREQIAIQAMESFKKVLGNTKSYGLLSGNEKATNVNFLFATVQTMTKSDILSRFKKDEFDVIVIDEVHRAGANSYGRIMEYFKPQFWLGMTASPERMDGFDIYKLFDHNIAYEIRLQQALEEDLLCPFHYFGITDLEIDGEVFEDTRGLKNFTKLLSDERVEYIIEQIKYYGFSGDRVKGLIFCSRKEEGKELSRKFNEKGFRTEFLSGEDKEEKREEYIERLTSDTRIDYLDYIITVDIFNEGVDIPELNQIIMLRPTKSPVIFVQQLGRGLRKTKQKEYVIILDFIGNYRNNFMIPIALSGDRTYNKDNLRKYVMEGTRCIPGCSTIHFDQISKERIFRSIDEIKGIKKVIRESYRNLKYKLGRIPFLMDFYNNGEIDPLLILNEYKSYHYFLTKIEKEYNSSLLSEKEAKQLEYLSKIIGRGKRPHELVLLKYLLEYDRVLISEVETIIKEKYEIETNIEEIYSALGVLQGGFVANEDEKKRYVDLDIICKKEDGFYGRIHAIRDKMEHQEYMKQLYDLISLGLKHYEDNYDSKSNRRGPFVLYQKYSRRDVCLLLNWGKDLSSTMYGMKRVGDDMAIFVTYHKATAQDEREYIEGKPDYADEFMDDSREIFRWDSQIGRGLDSSYMRDVCESSRKHLFIKKSDAEGTDYYYIGQFDIVGIKADKKRDNYSRLRDISKLTFRLHDPIREDLKDYLETN